MKKLFILLVSMTMAVSTSANPVTPEAALQKAAKFLDQGKARRLKGKAAALTQAHAMTPPAKLSATAEPVFYTFNIAGDNGFVIVSGDDVAPDILGYCDKGHFDIDSIPCNMRFWMDACAERIAIARKLGKKASRLSASNTITVDRVDVPVMIDAQWGQDAPYNDQCVFYGERCKTGCVATAMAQIAYYWGKGKSGRHYEHGCNALDEYGTWYYNIPALDAIESFDWDAMTLDENGDPDTDASKAAVAQLMRYCGQAVRMIYNSTASGALMDDAPVVFTENFGYKGEITKNNIQGSWNSTLYEELVAGHPVLMEGTKYLLSDDPDFPEIPASHAFVCDGYEASTNRFHINWGYGGRDDGYFYLDYMDEQLHDLTLEEILDIEESGAVVNEDGCIVIGDIDPYCELHAYTGISPWQDYSIVDGDKLIFYYDGEKDTRESSGSTNYTKIVYDSTYADYYGHSLQFSNCRELTDYIGMEYLNTSRMTHMRGMFEDCYVLKQLDLSHFETSNVRDMSLMFSCCGVKNIDISNFDVSSLNNLECMFYGSMIENINLGSFSIPEGANASRMFCACSSLKHLDLSNCNIGEEAKTTNMLRSLTGLESLTISSTMYRLAEDACSNTGTKQSPVTIYAPEGFDFGTETDGPYFVWKSGYFRLPGAHVLGDVNHDGFVNIMDVALTINYVLGKTPNEFYTKYADIDEDGYININDVSQIISLILGKK